MKKAALLLTFFVVGTAVGWHVYADATSYFNISTRYRTIVQGSTLQTWGPNCWVRSDYDLSAPAETERSRKFIKYLQDTLPPVEGIWRAVVVSKIGDGYEIHLPIKKGVENDFLWIMAMKADANKLSASVFDSKPVEWHLCDMFFNTCRVVTQ